MPINFFRMFRISGTEIDRLRMFTVGATRRRTQQPRRKKQRGIVRKKNTTKVQKRRKTRPRVDKTQIDAFV